jgi:hypothetical protein
VTVHDPEICTCSDCAKRNGLILLGKYVPGQSSQLTCSHDIYCNCNFCMDHRAEEYQMKRSKSQVEISVVRGKGELPGFLGLFHRHFQKAIPATTGQQAKLIAPLDLLDMMVPSNLLSNIESIEIHYDRGSCNG